MRLSENDYISILKYYNIDFTGMKINVIKKKAEGILAKKLCRCIKSVDKYKNNKSNKHNKNNKHNKKEAKAIAVCKNSVLTRKHLKISNFNCKKSLRLLSNNFNLTKTKKTLKLRKL
jgi:hypothetical protein